MPKISIISMLPQQQPDAAISQALPVQNTWYPILPLSNNVIINQISFAVADTGETLEVRAIIDGQTFTGAQIAAAGTGYYIGAFGVTSQGLFSSSTRPVPPISIQGRTIQVDIRKTTAAGAGTITARITYSKW